MAKICIRTAEYENAENELADISDSLFRITADIDVIRRSKVLSHGRSFAQIRKEIERARDSVKILEGKTRQLDAGLLDIIYNYEKTEHHILEALKEKQLIDPETENRISAGDGGSDRGDHGTSVNAGGSGGDEGSPRGWGDDVISGNKENGGIREWLTNQYADFYGDGKKGLTPWNIMKVYLELKEKGENPFANLGKNIGSYIKSIGDFLTGDMKGTTGAKNLCNLGKTSAGVWSGIYSFFKKQFDGKGGTNLFAEKWGRTNGVVGIAGNSLGFLGSYISAFNTDGKSNGEIIAGFVDTGGKGLGVIKSAYDLQHIKDTVKNTGGKKGLYSSAGKYATVAESTCSFVSQAIKSTERYGADGNYDVGDVGAICVESSVSGLYTMVSSLTFEALSEETTGVSAEDIGNYIKGAAREAGRNISNYVLNDPKLLKEYKNGGELKKMAILGYASIKSLFHRK